jgi:hypothetical protein
MVYVFDSVAMTLTREINSCLASSSPLILPFGLFYSVVKHLVDSYCLIVGVFKPTTVESRPFYLLVTNIMTFAALLSQINTVACLYVCPSREDQFYSSATAYSPGLIMVSIVVLIQQLQTNQRWPFRVIKNLPIVHELSEEDGPPEPVYEPDVAKWLHQEREN